jgi:hypothetical protein
MISPETSLERKVSIKKLRLLLLPFALYFIFYVVRSEDFIKAKVAKYAKKQGESSSVYFRIFRAFA